MAAGVVADGQNMQDCAGALDYEWHWNPVRLIQRLERLYSIGLPYDEIHPHNVLRASAGATSERQE